MTAQELAEKLKTIADVAPALRDAGVLGRVIVDGVAFEVCEAAVAAPLTDQSGEPPTNPLDDPDLYGGHVPQRRRPREEAPRETVEDDE